MAKPPDVPGSTLEAVSTTQPSVAERYDAQQAVLRALAETTDVTEGCRSALHAIASAHGWPLGNLWQVDERTDLLRLVATWSADDIGMSAFVQTSQDLTFQRAVGLPGRVWDSEAPVHVPDVVADQTFLRESSALVSGLHSAIGVPVFGERGVVGVMEFLCAYQETPDPATLDMLNVFAHQIGLYLERHEAQLRAERTETLTSAMIASALDCIVAMDYDGLILEFNPAAERTFGYTREQAVGQDLGDLIVPPELRDAHHGAMRRYLRTRESRILNKRLELEAIRADGSRFPIELTVVPMLESNPPRFTGFIRDITERRQAEEKVTRALEAEQEARRRAQEAEQHARQITRTLQRSLLPPELPAVAGLDIGAVFHPADVSEVGGDFYDVFEATDGTWTVVMGDIMGKGPNAAATSSLARHTLRAARMHADTPSEVLAALNTALPASGIEDTQCTAVCMNLRFRDDGTVNVCAASAGHPLPLIVRVDETVEPAAVRGTLLGAISEPTLHDLNTLLCPGDRIVVYTDGLTDVISPDGPLDVDDIVAVLRGCAGKSSQQIAATLEHEILGAPDREVRDDVALLVFGPVRVQSR